MREARILGSNVKVLLKNTANKVDDFAERLGYSYADVEKLCEGRLYSDMDDIKDIADYFCVTVDELLTRKSDKEYQLAGCVHYNHTFKEDENQDKIFDLFDMVCDIREAL
ncbi:MAG: helix-turn-helix domain-containing protein [Lachnospiraceae bacterium]